jgi:hypothetical protein
MRSGRTAAGTLGLVVTLLVTAACGGDDGGGGSADGVPRFVSGYAATCTDQAAFGGAAPFEADEDPFPIAFLYDIDDQGTFFLGDTRLPEGEAATELSAPDDAGEQARLAALSVVGCLDVASSEPSEQTCDFEDDDGNTTSLQVLDATYEVSLYEAKTGEAIGSATFDVDGDTYTCPIVMSIDDGQTTLLPSAEPEDSSAAVREALGG